MYYLHPLYSNSYSGFFMKKNFILFILLVLLFPLYTRSQELNEISVGSGLSIMPFVNYVSSATIQLHPFSNDIFEKSLTEELDGGYGYGISIKKKLFREDLSFGFSLEYLKIIDDELVQTFESSAGRVRARVTEELWLLPVEFTGYFNIPNFSEDIKVYLGGGIGVYFGDRKRTIANISSKTISKQEGFSFVVLSGLEFLFDKHVSGVFEIRFRQGEYRIKSEFPVSGVVLNGAVYPIEKNLNSRVFVDGLKLSLGVAYNF